MQTEETLIAKAGASGSNIPPHPEGQYAALCIDLIDLGEVETTWQGKTRKQHKIVVRFFCDEWFNDNEGKPRPLWVDKRLTFSLHEKGAMRPFLESWRGRAFSDVELHEGFNVAKLLHVPALIQIAHNVTSERTYANIQAILKLPKGMNPPGVPTGYVRVKDRPPKDQQNGAGPNGGSRYEDDDDLPF